MFLLSQKKMVEWYLNILRVPSVSHTDCLGQFFLHEFQPEAGDNSKIKIARTYKVLINSKRF